MNKLNSPSARRRAGMLACALLISALCGKDARAAEPHALLGLLKEELNKQMTGLVTPEGSKPYFLQYTVTDEKRCNVSAELGALADEQTGHRRALDVDLRCGDYVLDSTRQIRGRGAAEDFDDGNATSLPLNGDPLATRQALWLTTDQTFKNATKRLAQVKANLSVKVEEEDQSDDFSKEKPSVDVQPWVELPIETAPYLERIKQFSRRFRTHPQIYDSRVTLTGTVTNTLLVNSEGSELQYGRGWWRIGIQASTIAEDGMELWQYKAFDAHSPDGLPDDETINAAVDEVIREVLALRAAPIVEPYTGPAILRNRATGVFFHEIFGHRIEGHRQKDVEEGQTFAKKLGQPVLPEFLTVIDDPSRRVFENIELNGYYTYDAEAVPGQAVNLVDKGTLRTFLMSRSPTRGVNQSNGHGRRQPGVRVVARQGNLIVESEKAVPFDELRKQLLEECRKQNKDYGLLFEDISGGFTTTRRFGPQAFKVLPIVVYKVYVDGRPDELVRGVDIVGTPLTCFSRIIATGNDPDVFNGVCGAESGSVPVSAIAPSVLVDQIEVEKKQKAQDRPPILPAPIALEAQPGLTSAREHSGPGPDPDVDRGGTAGVLIGDTTVTNPQRAGASRLRLCVLLTMALLLAARFGAWARADEANLETELKQDIVLRALVDELDRAAKELKLADLATPYFIEYAVQDGRSAQAAAEFGALTGSSEGLRWLARVSVRVGSYELDNTNFRDGWSFGGGALPIESDYTAIRQALWWATDREYKQVAETLPRKRAFMEQKIIDDKPPDFSKEKPQITFEERLDFKVALSDLERIAIDASAVFRDYADVQESSVQLRAAGGNAYLVNTEGTRLREHGSLFEFVASAQVQADDGMVLADSFNIVVENFSDLPALEELQSRCRKLAESLIRLKQAPKLDEAYAGPVLMDAEPAAALFGANFSQRFAGGQRPVGAPSDPEDFEKKIGKRILPRSVKVVDDPTQERINGVMVLGHYDHDDQGVTAQQVVLVEGGRLQRQVMSRNPSRAAQQSTGHGNGFFRPLAATGCLIVTSDDAANADALRAELLETAQDEDLAYGIRVASLSNFAPLEVYKVFPDGREELVRGVEGMRLNLRAFKRIIAVGEAPFVLNVSGAQAGQTFVVPALLFEELNLSPVDRDFDKPPLLPFSLALKDAK